MYKITVLVENCVYQHKLRSEHGLSLLVETPQSKILFDTGSSDLFAHNARLLGIDLSDIDYLILSHGHGDHTGGLRHFLALNSRAKVICKRAIMNRKFKIDKENGIKNPHNLELDRFIFVDQVLELTSDVFVFPNIEIHNPDDTHFDKFVVDKGGSIQADSFDDEMALVLSSELEYHIISACSHRGITNIVSSIKKSFGSKDLGLLFGGFHIHNASKQKFYTIADFLEHNPVRMLGVCHCTGIDNYALFKQKFGDKVFYGYTGKQFTL